MQERIAESIGTKDASIFDAHLLVVEDRTLIDEVLRTLARDKYNVEYIFMRWPAATRRRSAKSTIRICASERSIFATSRGASSAISWASDSRDLRERHHAAHSRRAQSHAFGYRAAQPAASSSAFATDIGSEDFAHRDHGAVAEHSRRRRPARHQRRSSPRAIMCCSTVTTGWSSSTRPTRRFGNTASWRSRRRRSSRSSASFARPSRKTLDGRHVILSANIEMPEDLELVAAERRRGHRPLSHRVFLPQPHRAAERGGPVCGLSQGRGSDPAESASSSAPSISAATNS